MKLTQEQTNAIRGIIEVQDAIREILWPGEWAEVPTIEETGQVIFCVRGVSDGRKYGARFSIYLAELAQAKYVEIFGEQVTDWFQEELANYREVQDE